MRAVGIDQPQSVDIGWDGELADRYGQRIPVLQRKDGAELSWPFDAWTVKQFLAGA